MLIVYLGAIGGPIIDIVPYKYQQTPFQAAYTCGVTLTIQNGRVLDDEGLKYKLQNIGTVFVRYSNTVKEL